MLRRILFALLGLQVLDLLLLIWLSRGIGFWPTLAILLAMGLLGSRLGRREGRRVWQGWQTALAESRPPEEGVVDGMLVALGCVLLIAPGLASDVLGLVLFFAPSRRAIARALRRRLERDFQRRSPPGGPLVGVTGARGHVRRVEPDAAPAVIDTTGVESE